MESFSEIVNNRIGRDKGKLKFICKCAHKCAKQNDDGKVVGYKAFKNHNKQTEPTANDLADRELQADSIDAVDLDALYSFVKKPAEQKDGNQSNPVDLSSPKKKKKPKKEDTTKENTKKRDRIDSSDPNPKSKKKFFFHDATSDDEKKITLEKTATKVSLDNLEKQLDEKSISTSKKFEIVTEFLKTILHVVRLRMEKNRHAETTELDLTEAILRGCHGHYRLPELKRGNLITVL